MVDNICCDKMDGVIRIGRRWKGQIYWTIRLSVLNFDVFVFFVILAGKLQESQSNEDVLEPVSQRPVSNV